MSGDNLESPARDPMRLQNSVTISPVIPPRMHTGRRPNKQTRLMRPSAATETVELELPQFSGQFSAGDGAAAG